MSNNITPARAAALAGFTEDIFASIKKYVAAHVGPVKSEQAKLAEAVDLLAKICVEVPQRLAALEQRLRDLESPRG